MTGYDNTDQISGETDAEVYLYDASAEGGAGKLLCVSCNPSGSRPRGADAPGDHTPFWAAARILGLREQPARSAGALRADGKRLYFEAFDDLALRDTNGVEDVYQWEAAGTGGCRRSRASFSPPQRRLHRPDLLGAERSRLGIRRSDPDGLDVFFTTLASLLPQDFGQLDVYDARVDGGLPSPKPGVQECEGESCQHPPAAPAPQTPASSNYVGPGNVVEKPKKPKPCAKGKVRQGR